MDDLFKFHSDNVENVEKINLDELYEKKQEIDKNKLFTYNKILTRIHEKIKLTSRQKCDQHFCWFVVPEIILGVANYDHAGCIAYLVEKLQENKFMVRYTHPNLLLISWLHYVPNYVRTEFKKKTGTAIDEYGRPIMYVVWAGWGWGAAACQHHLFLKTQIYYCIIKKRTVPVAVEEQVKPQETDQIKRSISRRIHIAQPEI